MIAAVVFDFDGTLVDSNQIKRDAYFFAFERVRVTHRYITQVLKEHPGKDRYFIISAVVESLPPTPALTRSDRDRIRRGAVRLYSAYCRKKVSDARDFAGVTDTLRSLSRTYRLAINSATPERQLRQLVAARPWARYCTAVVGAPSTKVANLRKIAKRFSLQPREIMFIGDSPFDAAAATQFGCEFAPASDLKKLPSLIARRNGQSANA